MPASARWPGRPVATGEGPVAARTGHAVWLYLLIFVAMIVFLVFKPNGLFGEKLRKKV